MRYVKTREDRPAIEEVLGSKFWVLDETSDPSRFSRKSRESRSNNEIRFTAVEQAPGEKVTCYNFFGIRSA